MDDDPVFYRRFSDLLEQTIAEWRAQRMSDSEYLTRVQGVADAVVSRPTEDVPSEIRYDPVATAYYGLIRERIKRYEPDSERLAEAGVEAATAISRAIDQRRVVNWTESEDVQNRMKTAVEDELFAIKDRFALPLTFDDVDYVLDGVLNVARRRKA